MASYSSRVREDVARWAESGLIDRRAAEAISRDIESRESRSPGFGPVLAIMAALLFGAAILLFVAGNWEAIPRLARVAALFAIIVAGYVGGAALKQRGHPALAEAAWLIGAASFGGSIALIGQMYHLSGDQDGALLIWCLGTALAATVLRSGPLTMAAVALASTWMFFRGVDFWRSSDFPNGFFALAAVLWLISLWTRSVASRHLLLLSAVLYTALLAIEYDIVAVALLLAAVSAALLALAVARPLAVETAVRLNGRLPLHCLIGFLAGLYMVQIELASDDAILGFATAAAVSFAGTVLALVFAGRDSGGLRWAAYAGFAIELCLVYAVMVGTMLGTAGFFLASAIVLGALALAIIRIERRMKDAPALGAAA